MFLFVFLFLFFSDRTVSVEPSKQQAAAAAAAAHLGSMSCSIQLGSVFLKCWDYPTQQHLWLLFSFVCLFVVVFGFFLCLSLSDVGMLRFQTSVALWDRSSVSAGSVTVSLYQLQCLVEV